VSFSAFDHECMARALRLARKGLYTTDPNPRVGCVIADSERVIGQGWHQYAGGPHAEVAALQDAGKPVTGTTAYVTLEPCSYHGRTPPCTDALLEAGVSRVVVASGDPNPRVDGSGVDRLRAAGVRVDTGLMQIQAEALNPGFFARNRRGRSWLRVKSAVSLDGRIGLRNGDSKWISSAASRADVQRWRARSSAILTGIGTVLADDPSMTARVEGAVVQPTRVIADSHWRTPPDAKILAGEAPVLIAGDASREIPAGLKKSRARLLPLPADEGGIDLVALFTELAEMELNEVQAEAGSRLCGAFLEAGLVDELLLYQAPVLLGDGGPGPFAFGPLESMAERSHLQLVETTRFGDDLRLRLRPRPPNTSDKQ